MGVWVHPYLVILSFKEEFCLRTNFPSGTVSARISDGLAGIACHSSNSHAGASTAHQAVSSSAANSFREKEADHMLRCDLCKFTVMNKQVLNNRILKLCHNLGFGRPSINPICTNRRLKIAFEFIALGSVLMCGPSE